MEEKNYTLQDFLNMGMNEEAFELWNKGIYTEHELVELMHNNIVPIYTKDIFNSNRKHNDISVINKKQNVNNYIPRKFRK